MMSAIYQAVAGPLSLAPNTDINRSSSRRYSLVAHAMRQSNATNATEALENDQTRVIATSDSLKTLSDSEQELREECDAFEGYLDCKSRPTPAADDANTASSKRLRPVASFNSAGDCTKVLNLSHRDVRDIESVLSYYLHSHQLISLTIHYANLCKIPPLPVTLQRLDLSRNVIQTTQGLERARALTMVRLDHNALHALQPGLAHASKVVELFASHNQLRTLDGIQNLQKLKILDIRFNQIGKSMFAP